MEYKFRDIELKWQEYWRKNQTYKVDIDEKKPKFYVLDMFPYPSGAGLHVGHPLGYIASDIYARYKRLEGYNVLHPMGYDAYGLPAEQYAIETGQHPAITTEENLKRYRKQLDQIGFSFDWSREVKTCDPNYYKWTQWAFIEMFNHYYDKHDDKAKNICCLIEEFEKHGNKRVENIVACTYEISFSSDAWNAMTENEKQATLLNYRLAYQADTMVNWCPALGTVLANDEVVNGYSERGGHVVEQKVMRQWCLRVSAYSQRLLDGLQHLDWSDSIKEIQRNWIGRSEGAEICFPISERSKQQKIVDSLNVFTTRADTIFGVTFMVLAPESELVEHLTTLEQEAEVKTYLDYAKLRTERERQSEVKKITGVFSGSYAVNPLTKEEIPIWIADYVLAGYGTGAVMAVPAHDKRDFDFAKHFKLPIRQVVVLDGEETSDPALWKDSKDSKTGTVVNSGFLTGMSVLDAISATKKYIKENNFGSIKVNYRLRDAIFSRQRYWGEPFPVYYKEGMPYMLDEKELPLELPQVDNYRPTEDGSPPLGHAKNWKTKDGFNLELNTMPGFAGSSAYYLRYMDPHNDNELISKEANAYWQNVDLYIGGKEHATGHLIYSRFWNKFLYDIGKTIKDEPFQKLINQGMIQGRSNFVYRLTDSNTYVSLGLKDKYENVQEIHVDVNIVNNDKLDIEAFKSWRSEYAQAEFILENGDYYCGFSVEKMSKSLYNVVNPDYIIEQFGADTLRLYEMFLGPLEQSKPWDTNGIEGISRFLKKTWGLFFQKEVTLSEDGATKAELKVLHTAIKKVHADVENFSFNTAVSAFMICVNDLTALKCNKREILEPLVILLSPFAPHITEELWHLLGHDTSVCLATSPKFDPLFLVEDQVEYPVSFNGKMRFKISLSTKLNKEEVEQEVLKSEKTQKWLEGETPKKIIVVPGKIVNIVI